MKYYSINIVTVADATDEEAADRMARSLHAIEMVLANTGLAPELIMFTEVDKEWVANIHAELDEADEE